MRTTFTVAFRHIVEDAVVESLGKFMLSCRYTSKNIIYIPSKDAFSCTPPVGSVTSAVDLTVSSSREKTVSVMSCDLFSEKTWRFSTNTRYLSN